MRRDVVVVGAGISGLVTAWTLSSRFPTREISILDAAPHAGGSIRSERLEGYLCEWGPSGFLDNVEATLTTCGRLGLGERRVAADERAARRFVARRGKLRELPKGPISFLTSDVLSLRGRMRLLAEPLVPARAPDLDESVFDFARRRLGREAANVLVDALVTGIWAGSSERLSIRSALPTLASFEREHGGLLRGMIASGRRAARLTSFPEGLEELPAALGAALGSRLVLNARVTSIESSDGAFRVAIAGETAIEARAVVLACPVPAAAGLVDKLDGTLALELSAIPTVGVAVVHLGFGPAEAAKLSSLGFGFLVPRGEHASVLGVSFASNVFANRAPEGHALATVLLGGARDPEILRASDEQLAASAAAALVGFAGVRESPRFVRVIKHPHAIPQYELGHAERLAAIDERVLTHPGLFLTGSAYRGIAVNACITDGLRTGALASSFFA